MTNRYAIGMSNQKGRSVKSYENILDFKNHAETLKFGITFPLRSAKKETNYKTLSPQSNSPRGELRIFTYRKTVTSPLRVSNLNERFNQITEESQADIPC